MRAASWTELNKKIAELLFEKNEARERAEKAEKLLKKYECFEAAMIEDDEVWKNGLPQFTQELYQKWMELQTERNEILGRS